MDVEPFIQSVLDKSAEIFAEQKSIEPMLFIELGERCVIIPSGFFVSNNTNKHILAWIPAYLGLLSEPIRRCVFVSEFTLFKGNQPGVAEAMLEKYGSVLAMPASLTEDQLLLSVNDGVNDLCLSRPVLKDEKGVPVQLGEAVQLHAMQGLFFDFIHNASTLQELIRSLTRDLGITLPEDAPRRFTVLTSLTRAIAAKTGDVFHPAALDIAYSALSQLNRATADAPPTTNHSFH